MADGILTPCNVACGSGIVTVIRPMAAPCNVTRSSGIMTLNSPGGCTLQCGMWLWNRDSEFTKWQQWRHQLWGTGARAPPWSLCKL